MQVIEAAKRVIKQNHEVVVVQASLLGGIHDFLQIGLEKLHNDENPVAFLLGVDHKVKNFGGVSIVRHR